MNPKHRIAETPCKRCGGQIRYIRSGNCVKCIKAHVNRQRGSKPRTADLELLQRVLKIEQKLDITKTAYAQADNCDDLLGDLNFTPTDLGDDLL